MSIRTTVTLDEDVVRRLKQESRRRGIPFRQTINAVLRSGLQVEHDKPRTPFRVEPFHLGTYPGMNYDNIHELLDLVEGEDRR